LRDEIQPMNERDPNQRPPEEGVMGALPRSRPGIRSPRRARRSEAGGAAEAPGAQPDTSGERDPGTGLDQVVRAGASVASEAASLGAEIAGRAASALRGALERR
jgi:hypothetical protein